MTPLLCLLGLHEWGRASFVDSGFHTSVLDWKQKCDRCGKKITWVQPKGVNENFYPVSWAKKTSWLLWVILIIIGFLIYKYIIFM
jgi:hypothetical protein